MSMWQITAMNSFTVFFIGMAIGGAIVAAILLQDD